MRLLVARLAAVAFGHRGSSGTGGATTTGADAGTGGDASIRARLRAVVPVAARQTCAGGATAVAAAQRRWRDWRLGASQLGARTWQRWQSGSGGATALVRHGALAAPSMRKHRRNARSTAVAVRRHQHLEHAHRLGCQSTCRRRSSRHRHWALSVDEDIIIVHPESPLTDVQTNTADWDNTKEVAVQQQAPPS